MNDFSQHNERNAVEVRVEKTRSNRWGNHMCVALGFANSAELKE